MQPLYLDDPPVIREEEDEHWEDDDWAEATTDYYG